MGNQRGRLAIRRPGGEGEVVVGGGGGAFLAFKMHMFYFIWFTATSCQQLLNLHTIFFPEVHFAFYPLAHCEDFLKEFLVFKIGSLCLVFQPTPSLYQRFAP